MPRGGPLQRVHGQRGLLVVIPLILQSVAEVSTVSFAEVEVRIGFSAKNLRVLPRLGRQGHSPQSAVRG